LEVNQVFFVRRNKEEQARDVLRQLCRGTHCQERFFVTPDKGIQLTTVERQIKSHNKVEHMISYTLEHIMVLQSVFGIFWELVRASVTRSLNQSKKEFR
jgi:hypothetical protein